MGKHGVCAASFLVLLLGAAPQAPRAPGADPKVRCGWLDNSTPGNWDLYDRNGWWELAAQGSYEAPGLEKLPDLSGDEFVETNPPHGYACACVTAVVDLQSHRVLRVDAVKPRLLKACLEDKLLPPPPGSGWRR